MGNATEFPINLSSELGRELIVACAQYSEGLLDEKAIRKRFRFDADTWEALGSNEELIEKIEAEKLRRIHSGQQKRERAQRLVAKAPEILGGIMNAGSDVSPRHKIDAVKVLDDLAANGPGAAAEGPVFEIFINLGADQEGKPIVEHYRKPLAIDSNPSAPDDSDSPFNAIDAGVVAATAMKKKDDDR